MISMAFEERSRVVTDAATLKSPEFTTVMAFELKLRTISCGNWGSPAGMRVNLLPLRFITFTGVVGGIFLTMASISSVVSPWLEQSIVNVELLPVVGWQEQGRIEAVGHWQFNSESDENGVAVESEHVALTTNGDSVELDINHPSPPQPTVAPQSNGSKNN